MEKTGRTRELRNPLTKFLTLYDGLRVIRSKRVSNKSNKLQKSIFNEDEWTRWAIYDSQGHYNAIRKKCGVNQTSLTS